jgi:hypothetical protein
VPVCRHRELLNICIGNLGARRLLVLAKLSRQFPLEIWNHRALLGGVSFGAVSSNFGQLREHSVRSVSGSRVISYLHRFWVGAPETLGLAKLSRRFLVSVASREGELGQALGNPVLSMSGSRGTHYLVPAHRP